MFYKLALSNVKKSIKDYTVYFLTLTFGVCLFYVFNSIESQQVMLEISASKKEFLQMVSSLMGYFSGFVACILGFLIIYANNFLIKRRKKELGIYLTLGAPRGQISRMLMAETLIIGIFSLAVGLLMGIFVSQGLAVVTAQLFDVKLKGFQFTFSAEAFFKSVLYFGIIFLVVMVFNFITVSKYKLIDLIYGARKNQNLHVKKLWVSVVLFVLSAACLVTAYQMIIKNGMMTIDSVFWGSIVLGIIGTLLFFLSLSGFLLRLVKGSKRIYYSGLNMFVLRQINSKITTTYISMTLICLMLFCTICALSSGMGAAQTLSRDLDNSISYDATIRRFISDDKYPYIDIVAQLREDGIPLDTYIRDYGIVDRYESDDFTYAPILEAAGATFSNPFQTEYLKTSGVPLVRLSQYNRALEMQGKQPISLQEGEFAVNLTFEDARAILTAWMSTNPTVSIQNKPYVPGIRGLLANELETTAYSQDPGTLILPDSAFEGMVPTITGVNFIYRGDKAITEEHFNAALNNTYWKDSSDRKAPYQSLYTKAEFIEQAAGLKLMLCYLALYIGIVFLITSAAVLALQQLSESADNIERYGLLRKIGAEERQISGALFTQILIYFMMPLSLAIVHSVIGIQVVNGVIAQFGLVDTLSSIAITAGVILLIYGGYCIATYLASRGMIRAKR